MVWNKRHNVLILAFTPLPDPSRCVSNASLSCLPSAINRRQRPILFPMKRMTYRNPYFRWGWRKLTNITIYLLWPIILAIILLGQQAGYSIRNLIETILPENISSFFVMRRPLFRGNITSLRRIGRSEELAWCVVHDYWSMINARKEPMRAISPNRGQPYLYCSNFYPENSIDRYIIE